MHLLSIALAASLLPLALATPAAKPDLVPGVNIVNAALKTSEVVSGNYIVVYKADAKPADIAKHEAEVNTKCKKGKHQGQVSKYDVAGFKGYHLNTDLAGIAAIGKSKVIDFIELDSKVSATPLVVNSTNIKGSVAQFLVQQPSSTWGLGRISHRFRGFFNYIFDTSECQNTRVYVVDTGIRTTHVQFGGHAVWGANFISGSPNTDEHGHGTHCAGTVGGWDTGVCKLATIVAVKVLNAQGSGATSGVIAGMNWAANDAIAKGMGKRSVISMSLGGPYSAAENAAVAAIVARGIPVVVAAGNSNLNALNYSPSSAPSAITVGATDFYDNKASFSNWGTGLDIFAPGVTIFSSWNTCNTCYAYLDGTSQATPHVAGLAAYLIAKEGLASPAAVINRITALASVNKVINPVGSPNRLAYNGNGA